MDREAWRASIHGVAKSWTRLSDWTKLNKCIVIKTVCYLHKNRDQWKKSREFDKEDKNTEWGKDSIFNKWCSENWISTCRIELNLYFTPLTKNNWKCSPLFIVAVFIIVKTWKQPKCTSTNEWIKKMRHTYKMEYYSAIKWMK